MRSIAAISRLINQPVAAEKVIIRYTQREFKKKIVGKD
jgi:hypothetical protein